MYSAAPSQPQAYRRADDSSVRYQKAAPGQTLVQPSSYVPPPGGSQTNVPRVQPLNPSYTPAPASGGPSYTPAGSSQPAHATRAPSYTPTPVTSQPLHVSGVVGAVPTTYVSQPGAISQTPTYVSAGQVFHQPPQHGSPQAVQHGSATGQLHPQRAPAGQPHMVQHPVYLQEPLPQPTTYIHQAQTASYTPNPVVEYVPQVMMQEPMYQDYNGQPVMYQDPGYMEAAPVSNRAIAADMSVAFMPYFLIKDKEMDNFFEVCNQCIEQVKSETLCLSYGFAISTGSQNNMAFCRELFANAEGVLAHLQNIELLFKDGLCKYGELVSLQIHGPKVELDKLREDPVIQEMNPEFYELMPASFEIIEIPMQQMDYLPQGVEYPDVYGGGLPVEQPVVYRQEYVQPMYQPPHQVVGNGYQPQYEYVEEVSMPMTQGHVRQMAPAPRQVVSVHPGGQHPSAQVKYYSGQQPGPHVVSAQGPSVGASFTAQPLQGSTVPSMYVQSAPMARPS
uniref:Uncharacterized protein n=1 Tax=Noctiluca scintillans TaxID=2966 RepID=A0A7S1F2Q6_NOCSC